MSENTARRISKIASELNVGVNTIIEYLTANGHEDINKNSKISDDVYIILLKVYGAEKEEKEESKKIIQSRLKRETITIEDSGTSSKASEQDEPDEVLIHNVSPVKETHVVQAPPVVEIIPEVVPEIVPEPPQPEIVAQEVKAIEHAPEVKEDVIEEVKEEPIPEIVEEEKPASKESAGSVKVVGKIDLDKFSSNKSKKKTTPEINVKKEEPVIKPVSETIPEISPEIIEKPAEPEIVVNEKAEESTPELEPISESASVEAEPDVKAEPVEEEMFRTNRPKLSGPKVVRTIVLPTEPVKSKPTPVASSNASLANDKKKKRKRIAPSSSDPIKPAQGATANQSENRNKGGGNQGNYRPHETVNKAALTDEEIQKQIKETLARLSQTKSKSKSAKHRKQRREDARAAIEEAESGLDDKLIKVTEFVSANELAKLMNVQVNDIISTCMSLGLFVSINQRLDAETLSIVAEEFGYKVEFVSADVQEAIKEDEDNDDPANLIDRPPIVTVMGHVDHGKTSLLDYIRKANVMTGEAGGITQHIGAYNVSTDKGKKITFLDTPGHEAFTAMRARGAQVTDVAIIVVAADDNVMPQTIEAINHAQAAQVPIVFAINKIDKPGADPNRIREQLAQMNILVEDWGGKYQCEEISAKQGLHIDKLLEKVLLEAELQELKANPERRAQGTVIESTLDKGRGYITTVIVQNGTLRVGDVVLAGCYSGRVKALFNERSVQVKGAGPSSAALMLGLSGAPSSGDKFNVMANEREAREIANKRLQLQREQGIRAHKHITLDEIGRRIAIGDFKELNIIVKGDVDGSVEALADSLLKLSTEKIQVNIIHKSVGQVTEGDVLLASASNAIIVGFQVRPSTNARKLAENEQIDMRFYSVIFNAIEEIKSAMEGMLAPEFEEKIVCNVEVRDVFKITKVGTIAGCMVLDGKITRNTKIRLIRDGIVVYTGELGSLKRFKDDVKEVATGYECGLNINNFNDIKMGDIIEGYEQVEVKRKL